MSDDRPKSLRRPRWTKEDERIHALLSEDNPGNDELIKREAEKVRAGWTPQQEQDRMVKKRSLENVIPTIRRRDFGAER
jgi:hypothetical protein